MISLSRGYLFSGPPGTGKTSFALAIAGVFGLKIYCISLADPDLTEEALASLFSNLPKRCVVLLEDIDAAGLTKRKMPEEKEQKVDDDAPQMSTEIAKAFKAVSVGDKKERGLTLSALLNAIDGVSSHEGRVLVMTTNCPEKLDEALIRPGRIDMKIAFTDATRPQTMGIFNRMYAPNVPEVIPPKAEVSRSLFAKLVRRKVNATQDSAYASLAGKLSSIKSNPEPPLTSSYRADIDKMAIQFADHLPENVFTPAELQGFLLTRKREPERAVKEVEAWKNKEIEAKEARKVVKVEI